LSEEQQIMFETRNVSLLKTVALNISV